MGYELKSEVGDKRVREHANRLRRISEGLIETGEPKDGLFPDSLRMLWRITGTYTRQAEQKKGTDRKSIQSEAKRKEVSGMDARV